MRAPTLTRLAALSYASNCAVGTLVATGVVARGRIGWMHHTLFVCTSAVTVAAVLTRSRGSLWLVPTAVPLAVIPYAGGTRTIRHPLIGLSAAPFFAAALIASRR